MRWLLTLWLLFIGHHAFTQYSDYSRSVTAFRNLDYDSAMLYVDNAIRYFEKQKNNDSLVYAWVHKADMLWSQKGNQPALQLLDKILLQTEHLRIGNTAKVAVLNKKAQIHVHNAEAEKARKYFLQALSYIPRNAAPNAVYGNLYTNISWLYLELQDFTPALQYAEEAKRITEHLYGKDARQLIGVYQSLMLIAHDAGWFSQSEEYGKELLRLADLNLPPDHPNKGLVHNDLGSLYESMHNMDEAIFHRQKMVEIIQQDYAKHKNPQLLAIAYNNMGSLYSTLGEFQLAEEYFEKAMQLHEINFGSSGAGFVRPMVHLANAKRDLGDFSGSEQLYKRAYELQKSIGPTDSRNLAYVETQYGDLFFEKEKYAEAENLYNKALVNFDKAGIEHTGIVEQTQTTLGETYARTNRTSEALKLLNKVLISYKATYPRGNIVIAGQYDKISQTYLINNQPADALRYSDSVFLELLQIPVLPDSNWIPKLPYYHHVIRYLQHRADIEAALYKKTGKISALKTGIQIADQYGTFLQKSLPALRTQASLVKLAGQHKKIYNRAIESCWALYEQTKQVHYMEKAFEFAERSRALLLRLAANNIMVDASRTNRNPTDEQDLYWRKRISLLNTQYQNTDKTSDSLLTQLTASMEAYYRFLDSLIRAGGESAKLKYSLDPANIQDIQHTLRASQKTLVQYAVTGDAVYIFVLNGKQLKVRRVPVGVLQEVDTLKDLFNLSPETFSTAAFRLYDALIRPVEQYFTSDKLIIIPDGALFYLNFELLLSDNRESDFSKMNYLLHRYEIAYQLTATAPLSKLAQKNTTGKALLLTPVFTDAMKQAYLASMSDSSLADMTYFSLLRQPFTHRASKKISEYIHGDLYAEQDALEKVFRQTAGRYDILHLGTHAEVNHLAPLQSRFFLAKQLATDSAGNDDGYLHAYEVYGMRLRADLAVLTACESGVGNWSQGEGVMSLAHSFMYAGCPAVLMSLWKIDEKSSAEIITGFYEYLAAGKSKSEALRMAKLRHIQSSGKALAHPYFWAGMTLLGNDEPVFPTRSASIWVWGFVIILLVGVAGYGWRKVKKKNLSKM